MWHGIVHHRLQARKDRTQAALGLRRQQHEVYADLRRGVPQETEDVLHRYTVPALGKCRRIIIVSLRCVETIWMAHTRGDTPRKEQMLHTFITATEREAIRLCAVSRFMISSKHLSTSVFDVVHWYQRTINTLLTTLAYTQWDYNTSVEEVMSGLHHLVASGKVLYLVSDVRVWKTSERG